MAREVIVIEDSDEEWETLSEPAQVLTPQAHEHNYIHQWKKLTDDINSPTPTVFDSALSLRPLDQQPTHQDVEMKSASEIDIDTPRTPIKSEIDVDTPHTPIELESLERQNLAYSLSSPSFLSDINKSDNNTDLTILEHTSASELRDALRGAKRGRPVGSGVGQRRKSATEYSENQNTQRVRKQQGKQSDAAALLRRAKAADSKAIERAALKRARDEDSAFDQLDSPAKKARLANLKKEVTPEVMTTRAHFGYTSDIVRTMMETKVKMEIEEAELKLEEKMSLMHVDDDIPRPPTPDFESDESDIKLHSFFDIAALLDEEKAITDTRRLFLKKESKLTNAEQDQCMQIALSRRKTVSLYDRAAWIVFRDEFRDRIGLVLVKLQELAWLGDMFVYDAEGIPIEATVRWAVRLHDFWEEHQVIYQPHHFFDESDRGILRCLFGALQFAQDSGLLGLEDGDDLIDSTGEWITLPGPSEWWPDTASCEESRRYYMDWGFAPRKDLGEAYLKALLVLDRDLPPSGWEEALLHKDASFDLVWKEAFIG